MNKQTIQKLGLIAKRTLAVAIQEQQKKRKDWLSFPLFSSSIHIGFEQFIGCSDNKKHPFSTIKYINERRYL